MDSTNCVIVTGAAAGMGRELAKAFSARGLSIVLVDRNADGLAETEVMCVELGAKVASVAADLLDPGTTDLIVKEALARFDRVDILVNCAAIGVAEAFFEMSRDTWKRTLEINVLATVTLTTEVANAMRARGIEGRIINITSPASRMALPNYAAYSASKAAVDSFTRAASVALACHGIKVNSVAPGMMDTEMQRSVEADMAKVEGRDDVDKFLEERTRRVPLGRRAEVSEIVDCVLWLALEAPDYVTCSRLNASGGLDKD